MTTATLTASTASAILGTTPKGNAITPVVMLHTAQILGQEDVCSDAINAVADYVATHYELPTLEQVMEWLDLTDDGVYNSAELDEAAVEHHTQAANITAGIPVPVTKVSTPTPVPSPRPDANAPTAENLAVAKLAVTSGTFRDLRSACDILGIDADRTSGQEMTTKLEAYGTQPTHVDAVAPARQRKVEPVRPSQIAQHGRLMSVRAKLDKCMAILAECGQPKLSEVVLAAYKAVQHAEATLAVDMGRQAETTTKGTQSRTDTLASQPAPKVNPNVTGNPTAALPIAGQTPPTPVETKPATAPKTETPVASDAIGSPKHAALVAKAKSLRIKGFGLAHKWGCEALVRNIAKHTAATKAIDAKVTETARKQSTQTPTPTPVAATKAKTVTVEVPTDREAFIRQLLSMSQDQFAIVVGSVN